MDALITFFVNFVSEIGSLLLVPLIIFFMGLLVGLGAKKSFRSSLITGVALVGIYTILGVFLESLQPVAEAISTRFGGDLKLDYIDLGWPACFTAGVSLPTVIGYVMIGVLVNIVLVAIGWVKTLSIEMIGPIMGEGIVGYVVFAVSGNFWLGLIASLLIKVFVLKLADWQGPAGEEFFGFEGITMIQTGVNEWGLLGFPLAKLMDKIPFLNKNRYTSKWVSERFGVFGEPMFLGLLFGVILGLLGGYGWSSIVILAIYLAAAVNIMPRMVSILMEGLVPVMRGVGDWMQKNAKGREIYIGMDPALGVGHPDILATVMIMIPITILVAIILPGNRVLPLGDLSTLVFTYMFLVVANKGDILRSVITCIIATPILLWLSSWSAPYIFQVLVDAGVVDGAVNSTCMFEGGIPYWAPFAELAKLLVP